MLLILVLRHLMTKGYEMKTERKIGRRPKRDSALTLLNGLTTESVTVFAGLSLAVFTKQVAIFPCFFKYN